MYRQITLLLFACLIYAAPAAAQLDVEWVTLAQVKLIKEEAKYVPQFEADIQNLLGQEITLQGFMLPLDQAPKQQHFILSANPVANCFFCMPGGPESLVEIKTDKAVEFSYDPIVVSGKLELLKDDPMGMYYRISAARIGD